jgi:hypothetical protein
VAISGSGKAELAAFGEMVHPSVGGSLRFHTRQQAVISRGPTGIRAGAGFKPRINPW